MKERSSDAKSENLDTRIWEKEGGVEYLSTTQGRYQAEPCPVRSTDKLVGTTARIHLSIGPFPTGSSSAWSNRREKVKARSTKTHLTRQSLPHQEPIPWRRYVVPRHKRILLLLRERIRMGRIEINNGTIHLDLDWLEIVRARPVLLVRWNLQEDNSAEPPISDQSDRAVLSRPEYLPYRHHGNQQQLSNRLRTPQRVP